MKLPDLNWTKLDLPKPPDSENFTSDTEHRRALWWWKINCDYLNWKYTKNFQKILLGLTGLGSLGILVTIVYVAMRILG